MMTSTEDVNYASSDKNLSKILGLPPPYSDLIPAPRVKSYSTLPNRHRVDVIQQPNEFTSRPLQRHISEEILSQRHSNSNNLEYSNIKVNVVVKKNNRRSVCQRNIFGPIPTLMHCYNCHYEGKSWVMYEANRRTHICATILCLVGWCCCICCLPYCTKENRTARHYCMECGTYFGVYVPVSFH